MRTSSWSSSRSRPGRRRATAPPGKPVLVRSTAVPGDARTYLSSRTTPTGLTGLKRAVADVRRLDAELEDRVRVPVIVPPTAHDPPEVQRCYDLGRSSYVTRPVEYARFVEAIRKRGSFPSIVQAPATPPARRS